MRKKPEESLGREWDGCAAGYLPGMMQPHIKFFGIMSLTYLMLGIVWAALYAQHWKEVFALQHCITAVVALGMMEMSTWSVPSLPFYRFSNSSKPLPDPDLAKGVSSPSSLLRFTCSLQP